MNNVACGKTMENLRNRVDVRLVNHYKKTVQNGRQNQVALRKKYFKVKEKRVKNY